MKEQTYQDKVWQKNEAGELEYVGEETRIITFKDPLKLSPSDQAPVDSITLTEPSAGQLQIFANSMRTKDDVAATIDFIAANCGKAPAYIRKMSNRDFVTAQEFLGGFTKPEPKAED